MKAITIHQPWATLIALGVKPHETRSWPTKHRGPLAIHASRNVAYLDRGILAPEILVVLNQHGLSLGDLPTGAIVCTCRLVGMHHTEDITDPRVLPFGDYTPGRWAWEVAEVKPLAPPVPARGFQQLWEWNPAPANTPQLPLL